MVDIILPTDPAPREMHWRPIRAGGLLEPTLGGPDQDIGRMGDKWEVDFQMPPMRYGQVALRWVARLSRARGKTVRLVIPQPGLDMRGRSGAVLVKGAGQAGTSLIVDGGTAQYPIIEGQAISLTTGGRSYVYLLAADVRFDEAGEATLPIDPMLRASPADNSPVEIEAPVIEGRIRPGGNEWTVDVARTVGLSFTIREVA